MRVSPNTNLIRIRTEPMSAPPALFGSNLGFGPTWKGGSTRGGKSGAEKQAPLRHFRKFKIPSFFHNSINYYNIYAGWKNYGHPRNYPLGYENHVINFFLLVSIAIQG